MAITLHQVTKYYDKQKALDEVSFTLEAGGICGFLGPNGAGKSTTMKIITGYLSEYTGTVKINDIDLRRHPLEAKKLIGYLPEHNPLYPDMYIREYLEHVARLYHIASPCQKTEEIICLTGLTSEIKKKIGQLSKGYRQRVGLAQALIHDPEILILDEPMTGLDPNQLEEIRQLIKTCGKDKTVLLSTHIMQEVEAVCDRVMIINRGKIVADQSIRAMQSQAGGRLNIYIRFAPGTDSAWLAESGLFQTLRQASPEFWQGTASVQEDPRTELFNLAARHQCPIIELRTEEDNLEKIFRELTRS
ncbi:MAG: ATP-binding cassette domain-containing protein [Odoribacter sp.]|nr:ATP-binding cassette domain-containing protein [Odoribacter sp.]